MPTGRAVPAPSTPGSDLDRRDLAFLVLLLAGFVALATWVNFRKNIWLDETFTLERTGLSLANTLYLAEHRSLKPPLYFVAVYYWRHFGDSIEWVRGLSTASVAIALVYLYRISAVVGIGRGWRSAAVVAALTPHLIWAAVEARTYGFTIMCLTASTYYCIRLWGVGSERPLRDNILFVLFAYAAILSFYYAGFLVAGLFVAGLFGRDLRRLVWSGVALALLLAPWLPQVARHVGEQGNYMSALGVEDGEAEEAATTLGAWLRGLIPMIVFRQVSFFSRPGVEPAYMLAALGLLVGRVAVGRPRWTRVETMLWVASGVGIGMLALIRISNVQMMDLRHWSIAAPSLVLLAPLLASRLRPEWASRLAALGIVGAFALTTVSYARNEEGRRNFRGVAGIISRDERAGEPILVLVGNPAGLRYYYKGENAVHRLPIDPTVGPVYHRGGAMPPADVVRVRQFLERMPAGPRSFWMVEQVDSPVALGMFEEGLGARLTILKRRVLTGLTVTHVQVDGS